MAKIPFYLISGFLGSGKTTLLKRIIEKFADGKNIGIIQNEFAPINIDSIELLRTHKVFNLLEINNGSVFCVCLLGDFINSLSSFIDQYKPEILIMEASGLSDTTSVSEVLISPLLSSKIYLASNWCVVDALNFERVGAVQQRVVHQVRMADVILINKSDLARESISIIANKIKKINPFATIRQTIYCNIDFDFQASQVPRFYLDQVRPMERPAIHSMVIKSGRNISVNNLHSFLEEWAGKAFRIKGYVNLTDGTTMAVQCSFGHIQTQPTEKVHGMTELIALSDLFTLSEWSKSFRDYCEIR